MAVDPDGTLRLTMFGSEKRKSSIEASFAAIPSALVAVPAVHCARFPDPPAHRALPARVGVPGSRNRVALGDGAMDSRNEVDPARGLLLLHRARPTVDQLFLVVRGGRSRPRADRRSAALCDGMRSRLRAS